jgi:uncharacterized protein YdeI (YjbR/CyaY-like superfamily)
LLITHFVPKSNEILSLFVILKTLKYLDNLICRMFPKFFAKQSDFRKWLVKNHKTQTELLVGFYKVNSGKSSMTWPQSVDEALCFGWIDSVRNRIDVESYSIRFTPRKPTSIWSAVNIKKIEDLTKKGMMQPDGLAAFEKRTENKSKVYAYEHETAKLSPEFEKTFKANKNAWAFFTAQAPSYQKTMMHWIMRAKQEATQLSRLEKTISVSENQKRVV